MLSGGLDARGASAHQWPDTFDAGGDPRRAAAAAAASPATDVDVAGADAPIADWWSIVGLGVLLAAGGLWARSVSAADPTGMTELGLISVLPVTFFVALVLLTAGFVALSSRPARSRPLLAAYLGAFVVAVFATPIAVFGTLGNAWAWANVGVVDFVQRTGGLPPVTESLAAPTEWPGTYALTALLAEVSGLEASTLAMWMPLCLTAVSLLALWVLFNAITSDERIVWTALWLYVLGTWTGQQHLAPLGLAVALSLALVAVALPLDRTGGSGHLIERSIGPVDGSVRALGATVAFIGIAGLAVVATHQVAPIALAAVFAIAAATRVSRTLWLAFALAVATAVWFAGPAWSIAGRGPRRLLEPLGSPAEFALATTRKVASLDGGTQVVLIAGRFVLLALAALAVAGLLGRWRWKRPIGFLVAACVASLAAVLFGGGSEAVLRAAVFALPWVAVVAAFALARPAPAPGRDLALRMAVVGVLTIGFVVAESGQRAAGSFSSSEAELASWLTGSTPSGTLLITGTLNSPLAGENIEHLTSAPLTAESPEFLAEVAADPELALLGRIDAARAAGFDPVFVVLTRSQQLGEQVAPQLAERLLPSIEASLRGSPRFTVVGQNADGVVFAAVEGGP